MLYCLSINGSICAWPICVGGELGFIQQGIDFYWKGKRGQKVIDLRRISIPASGGKGLT